MLKFRHNPQFRFLFAVCVLSTWQMGCSISNSARSSERRITEHLNRNSKNESAERSLDSSVQSNNLFEEERPAHIQVCAFNAHLLPEIASLFVGKRGQSRYRSTEIGQRMRAWDIIGLSEVFDSQRSKDLITSLQEQAGEFHIARGLGRRGRHLTGSGLLLASRFPIISSNQHTFQNSPHLFTKGPKGDGLAAKGILHARLKIGKLEIDCFLTHLESQNRSVRDEQTKELKQFLEEHRNPEIPALLMGDFNIVFETSSGSANSEYEMLMKLIGGSKGTFEDAAKKTEGPAGTSDALAQDGDKRIDYIFFSNSTDGTKRLRPIHSQHEPFLDSQVREGSLSDHLAIISTFEVQTAPDCWQ